MISAPIRPSAEPALPAGPMPPEQATRGRSECERDHLHSRGRRARACGLCPGQFADPSLSGEGAS